MPVVKVMGGKLLTYGRLWRDVRDRFVASGIDSAALDARLLAQHAFGLDGAGLIAREREPVTSLGAARLEAFAKRRLAGEPVARIIGEKEFWGRSFGLNAATLVPRPETEMLVEFGLAALAGKAEPSVLDLGTGTGCIPVSLLAERRDARAVAVDISDEALAQADANALRHGVADRLDLRRGSWFEPLVPNETFDLIVSNPPYIARGAMAGLMIEVRIHDPAAALDGGTDGFDAYRIIAPALFDRLKPGGNVFVEIGAGQGEMVAELFRAGRLANVAIHNDLSGHQRVVSAARK